MAGKSNTRRGRNWIKKNEDFVNLDALTVVTGGAKSGKSRFAEGLATASGRPRVYIATAEAWDDEMRSRIAAHLKDRGTGWQTVEAPRDVAGALALVGPKAVVLLDCATLWLTNHMLADADLARESVTLLQALKNCPAPVIVV
ncbi:MAG: adenosylcobinamide kinase/adenosylcobinamide-phosphate guanylyltransferase, partial [Pseudorhodobacter sp.]